MIRPVVSFILEVGVWFGSALVFLGAYSYHHVYSLSSAWIHLIILSAVFTVLVFVRMLLWHMLPGNRWPRWFGSAIGATLLLGLASYYALVIFGLNSWGQVVSWQLISTYTTQWQELALSQGVSPSFVVGCVMGLLGLITAVIAFGPGRWDWTQPLSLRMWSSRAGRLLQFGALAIVAANAWAFVVNPSKAVLAGEPLSLTLFPDWQRGRTVQDYRVTGSVVLDRTVERIPFHTTSSS